MLRETYLWVLLHLGVSVRPQTRLSEIETPGFFMDAQPCDRPTGAMQCQAQVNDTLRKLDLDGVTDIGARIGAVLAAQSFLGDCCEKGTDYDEFIFENPSIRATDVNGMFDPTTALVIIDMQKDFVSGSFAQPCWSVGMQTFAAKMTDLIGKAQSAGSLIIASKDVHPTNHCSFGGEQNCKNTKDTHEISAGARYVNEFPSHCTFTAKDGYASPQAAPNTPFCISLNHAPPICQNADFIGAAFEDSIGARLANVPSDQLEVVFKGFNKDYDSFSAMAHKMSKGALEFTKAEEHSTGSYALPSERARECHGKWDTDPSCYPMIVEMMASQKGTGPLRSFKSILEKRQVRKIVVVGLVYDYCVKETAIFTRENLNALDVQVIADLTRPSFDGKPGAPYTGFVCDAGDVGEHGYCNQGGGTKAAHAKAFVDYANNDVEVVRWAECAP